MSPNGLDITYLKAHSRPIPGDLSLNSAQATRLPSTEARNPFHGRDAGYRSDPSRRVVLVFSDGDFDSRFSGDLAASQVPPGGQHWPYRLDVGALDAETGSLIFEQTPACK